MSNTVNRWTSLVRSWLNFHAIERDVSAIKQEMTQISTIRQEISTIIPDIRQDITDLKKVIEDHELRRTAIQAVFTNQQHQQMEITTNEFSKVVEEIDAIISKERARRDEAERKLAESIAELAKEMHNLRRVVDEHFRSTMPKL